MEKFSDELKQKIIVYFGKKYGVTVTDEEAEEYLDSIAGLYLTLADDGQRN